MRFIFKKAELKSLEFLLQAVVSLYLYMANVAKLTGKEINFIDKILRSMFGNEIPLYEIEFASQNRLSIREAANVLNQELDQTGKLKVVLNLIALAYHDRQRVHVLGNVEIVELVDLLRLDVNILDRLIDLFEGLNNTIQLPDIDLTSTQDSPLHNSMVWGPVNTDFKFYGQGTSEELVFIMIEDLVLIRLKSTNGFTSQHQLISQNQTRTLQPGLFYLIQKDNQLILDGKCGKIQIGTETIWQLYHLMLGKAEFHLAITGSSSIRIRYQNNKLIRSRLAKGLRSYKRDNELALDLPVEIKASDQYGAADRTNPSQLSNDVSDTLTRCPLSLLANRAEDRSSAHAALEHFLEKQGNRYYISSLASSSSLLRFGLSDGIMMVQSLSEHDIFLNRKILEKKCRFVLNQDIISIGNSNFLINRNWELVEIPIEIKEINIDEIYHTFDVGAKIALDSVSFKLKQGSMLAIMGPSGSGKTTLLKVLLGEIKATRNRILIDGMDFVSNFTFFQKYIGYVPQDDLLFANLTVYENLYYNLRLRMPQIRDSIEINTRIDNLLRSVGLIEQKHLMVGDAMNKMLSGGQRRRLNIALELISNPMIMVLDEPTSGLSSKDSESIAGFLAELKDQGKIIVCTIHQPNATIFSSFDSVLLMDKGGSQVYFGSTEDVFNYFDEELELHDTLAKDLRIKKERKMPEYLYDLIELNDETGNRVFSPIHWKQKFRAWRFREAMDVSQSSKKPTEDMPAKPKSKTSSYSSFFLLFRRALRNKLRNKMNLLITLVVAPLLALLTAFVLRSVPDELSYTFGQNHNFLLFGFISIIIFVFIGMANSVDDLLSEKRIIQREKKLNISSLAIVSSKQAVLFLMTLIQAFLYYSLSAWVLGMRGFALPSVFFLVLSGVVGYKFGLLASALINDRAALINILPLVIIPQIMFGGAVIRFSDMNNKLRIFKTSEIPEFCQIIPSRWLFEGLILAQETGSYYNLQNTKLISAIREPKQSRDQRKENLIAFNHFQKTHPESKYTNEAVMLTVRMAEGRFIQQNRNVFLSPRFRFLGREIPSLYINIAAIISITWLLGFFAWIKLRYFYK